MPARDCDTVVVTLLSASVWTGAATPSIASRWKDRDIQVDGALRDWTELGAFEDALSVAAVNDNRELYLAIATSDPQRQARLSRRDWWCGSIRTAARKRNTASGFRVREWRDEAIVPAERRLRAHRKLFDRE